MKTTKVGCALVLVGALAGCSGSSSPSTVTTTTPAPTRSLITQGAWQLVDSDTALRTIGFVDVFGVPFTVATAGTLDVTVDWTFRTNDVDIYIFRGACNGLQLVQGQCGPTSSALASSISTTAKPETLSVRLDPGTYSLAIFQNVGNSAESGTYAIFLTR